MRLGNSNGNNTGKKYFLRGKDDLLPPPEANRPLSNIFNEWYIVSKKSLINFLVSKCCYDEDVCSDTYMRMLENILYTGIQIKDYRAYFHRSYYTNYIQQKVVEKRFCPMLPFDNRVDSILNLKELDALQRSLEDDIFDYVYKHYDLHEFELFKMYISLKPAVNYNTLSDITQIKAHNIQRVVSKIKKDIMNNKILKGKYNEIKNYEHGN